MNRALGTGQERTEIDHATWRQLAEAYRAAEEAFRKIVSGQVDARAVAANALDVMHTAVRPFSQEDFEILQRNLAARPGQIRHEEGPR